MGSLLLAVLPDWVFHTILILGVLALLASVVLKFIPFINTYKLPVQVGGVLFVLLGMWFEGAISNQAEWEARVAEMKVKVAEAEAKSSEANVKIVTKIVKKTKRIHEKGDEIISYIDREVVKNNEVIKFVENCPIPDIIIKTHNAAATNTPIEAKK